MTECKVTQKNGANKICANPECNLNNRFICGECEEAHEHGGSLSMVRINKIKQISQAMKKTVSYAQQISSLYQEIFNTVKKNAEIQLNKMKNIITSCSKNIQQIEKLFNEPNYSDFPKLWEDIQKKLSTEQIKSMNNSYVDVVQKKVEAISYLMQQEHRTKSGVLRRNTVDNSEDSQKYSVKFIEDLMTIFKLLPSNFEVPLSDFASSSIKKELKKLQEKSKLIKEDLIISKFYEIIGEKLQFQRIVNKMLEKQPINKEILAKKAVILKQQHKYKQAIQIYTQLITTANKGYDYEVYCYERGVLQQLLGNHTGAQRDFRACLNNDIFGARMKLVNMYQHQNRPQQAEGHLLHITQKDQFSKQDKIKAYSILANMASQQGKGQKAIDYYTNALKHNPQHFQNIVNRASLYHQNSKHQLARKDYTEALRLKPNNAHLYYNRGVTSLSLGDKNNACHDFLKAIQSDSNFKLAYLSLANLYMQIGNKQQAFHYYQKCTHFFPKNEIVWHNYAILLKSKMPKQSEKILEPLNKVLQINPNNETALLSRVQQLMKMEGKQRQLEIDLTKLIELGAKQTSIIYNRAVIRENMKQHQKALEDLQTILSQHPQNLLALRSKAKILSNMNRIEECQKVIQKIQEIEKQEKN